MKNRENLKEIIVRAQDKDFVIINGKDLIEIPESKDKYFWKYKNRTEMDYLRLIKESQMFFKMYIQDNNCKGYTLSENYDPRMIWIYSGNCVRVRKFGDKYMCIMNGRHRCAVAKKYKLDILVSLW